MKHLVVAALTVALGCGSGQGSSKPAGGDGSGASGAGGSGAAAGPGGPAKHDRDAGPVEPLSQDVEVPPAP